MYTSDLQYDQSLAGIAACVAQMQRWVVKPKSGVRVVRANAPSDITNSSDTTRKKTSALICARHKQLQAIVPLIATAATVASPRTRAPHSRVLARLNCRAR